MQICPRLEGFMLAYRYTDEQNAIDHKPTILRNKVNNNNNNVTRKQRCVANVNAPNHVFANRMYVNLFMLVHKPGSIYLPVICLL